MIETAADLVDPSMGRIFAERECVGSADRDGGRIGRIDIICKTEEDGFVGRTEVCDLAFDIGIRGRADEKGFLGNDEFTKSDRTGSENAQTRIRSAGDAIGGRGSLDRHDGGLLFGELEDRGRRRQERKEKFRVL